MSKIAYFDCPTGIAGDMCLGALLDVGVPLDYMQVQLQKLGISDRFTLTSWSVNRQGQQATLAEVLCEVEHHHRHLSDIKLMIQNAQFPQQVEQWSIDIFTQLAKAEAKIHGTSPEAVHFHEVGAVDAIVDIVGTCLGLDWLGIEQLYCSALPTGGGTVTAAHGALSVPVPAVLQLWAQRQVPVYSNGIQMELVTPTGAAIAVTLAESFGQPPMMTLQKIGLGAGQADLQIPNALRLWVGESPETTDVLDIVMLLETQIDDMNPQVMGLVYERLLRLGALDVWTQPVAMKKQRPGLLLSVLCHLDLVDACEDILFQETTTLGIRRTRQERKSLDRALEMITTPYGDITIKVAFRDKTILNVQPEYEDCVRCAQEAGIPWWQVQQMAIAYWHQQHSQLNSTISQ